MAAKILSYLVAFGTCCCLVFGEPIRRAVANCDQPVGCTNSMPPTCFFAPECNKPSIKAGSGLTLGYKRDVDCAEPSYCDRCIPVTCYFAPECKKEPITRGPILGTLGKRCLGNMGTLG